MGTVLGDITSPRLLVVKGVLFVVLGALASMLMAIGVVAGLEWWTVLIVHAVAVWAWCRAYYFAFYVLERYAGAGPYAGVWAAGSAAWRVAVAKGRRAQAQRAR